MEHTDNPNEDDSTTTTPDPSAQRNEEREAPFNLFFVFLIMLGVATLALIVILSVWIPYSLKQTPSMIILDSPDEDLPFITSSSSQPQDGQEDDEQNMLQTQKHRGGILRKRHVTWNASVVGGNESCDATDEPRDVRKHVKHVTWNASVVGGNESCNATATTTTSDDAGEYVRLDELRDHLEASVHQERPRASPFDDEGEYVRLDELRDRFGASVRQERPRASTYDEEPDHRGGCTRNAQAVDIGQEIKPNRAAETESLDDQLLPPVPLAAGQCPRHLEDQQKVEHPDDDPNAEQTLLSGDREASDLRDAQAEGGESLAAQSSMSVRLTAKERLRLLQCQRNIKDDNRDNDAAGLSSREEESLYDEQPTQTAQESCRRRQNFDEEDADDEDEDDEE